MTVEALERNPEEAPDSRVAVIDIGSNSIRLVVFDGVKRAPSTVFNEKVLCGLGREVASTGKLSREAVEMALPNLERFVRLSRAMGIGRVDLLATAAVREAADGADFAVEVEKRCQEPVRILSGLEEARLSALGVLAGTPQADGIMGDLGGGSLELVDLKNGEVERAITLPLGPLRLMDICGRDQAAIVKEINKHLSKVDWLLEGSGRSLFPVGGAWRNLVRLQMERGKYPLHVIHGFGLRRAQARALARLVGGLTPETLKGVKGVSKRRLEALPYGALVLDRLLAKTKCRQVHFSSYGLREGFFFDQLSAKERAQDPLLEMVRQMAEHETRFPDLADTLVAWTDSLFQSEGMEDRHLRVAACHLSDISWREHVDYRAEQAFRRVLYSSIVGVDHPGRVFIAFTLFVRYGGRTTDRRVANVLTLLSDEQVRQARILGLALTLAYRLSGATAKLLRHSRLYRDGTEIQLDLPADGSLPDGEAVRKSLNALREADSVVSGLLVDD